MCSLAGPCRCRCRGRSTTQLQRSADTEIEAVTAADQVQIEKMSPTGIRTYATGSRSRRPFLAMSDHADDAAVANDAEEFVHLATNLMMQARY